MEEETSSQDIEESTVITERCEIYESTYLDDEESGDFSSLEVEEEVQEPTKILIVKYLDENEDEHFFRRALEYLSLELITCT